MTPETLDELERLEKDATPGPWHDGDGLGLIRDARGLIVADADQYQATMTCAEADAALIPAMRNALPDLLKEILQLRAERSTVRARAIEEAANVCGPVSCGRPDCHENRCNGIREAQRRIRALAKKEG